VNPGVFDHRRSQGPATLGSWPGSHGRAEAGGEREVRTQGRRTVRGGRRRLARGGRGSRRRRRRRAWDCPSVAGRRRGGAAPIPGTEPEREWGKERKMSVGAALQGAGCAWV